MAMTAIKYNGESVMKLLDITKHNETFAVIRVEDLGIMEVTGNFAAINELINGRLEELDIDKLSCEYAVILFDGWETSHCTQSQTGKWHLVYQFNMKDGYMNLW